MKPFKPFTPMPLHIMLLLLPSTNNKNITSSATTPISSITCIPSISYMQEKIHTEIYHQRVLAQMILSLPLYLPSTPILPGPVSLLPRLILWMKLKFGRMYWTFIVVVWMKQIVNPTPSTYNIHIPNTLSIYISIAVCFFPISFLNTHAHLLLVATMSSELTANYSFLGILTAMPYMMKPLFLFPTRMHSIPPQKYDFSILPSRKRVEFWISCRDNFWNSSRIFSSLFSEWNVLYIR